MTKELEDAFRKLKERDVDTFPATVVSVDKAAGTCVVLYDEMEFTDVRLSALIDDNAKKSFLFPKVGSDVLVSPIMEDLHKLYVEMYSELDGMTFNFDTVTFSVDGSGLLLKKENLTMKNIVQELLAAIKGMSFQVTTTAGNGNTTILNNAAAFDAVENKFNQILKGI